MAVTINGSTGVNYADKIKHKYGTGDDLEIYHDGSTSYIKDTGTGLLKIESNQLQIKNDAADEKMLVADANGAVELYYDNAKVFETLDYGARIKRPSGGATSLDIVGCEGQDAVLFLAADDGDDNNDQMRLIGGQGSFSLQNYTSGSWETNISCFGDGQVELNYDNNKKLHTYSEGVKVTGYIKAADDASDSHWGDNAHDWHGFHQASNGNSIAIFENSGDTTPYGLEIYFTDVQPDNNTNYFLYASDVSNAKFRVYSDGDVWTSDAGTLSSDETLKENIVDATPKLEDLKKLKVRNFNWKSSFHPEKSKKKQLGFIAQEVEEVFPALITEHDVAGGSPTDSDHTPVMKKAIKQAWDPIIIKAMQELIAKVETLETKVAALEAHTHE